MNTVDLVVLAVIAGSAMLAFARGFLLEILSLTGYAGAAIVTFVSMPLVQPIMHQHIAHPLTADAVSVVLVFVVTVGIFAVINNRISEKVRKSSLNAVDRSLGFMFGAVRGVLVVSLAYLLATWLWPEDQKQPELLTQAKTLPLLQYGGSTMRVLVVDIAGSLGAERADAWFESVDKGNKDAKGASGRDSGGDDDADGAVPAAGNKRAPESAQTPGAEPDPLAEPAPQQATPARKDPSQDSGYRNHDRAEMDRLIETTH